MPLTESTAPLSLVLLHHRHRPSSSLVAAFAAATKRVRAGTLCPEDAHHLLDELLQQATPALKHSLNDFLAALARAPASGACSDGLALAVALFNRVFREEATGPQVAPFTGHTYYVLVESCCRARRLDLALSFFGRFLKTGLNSDDIVANALRRCLSISCSSFTSPTLRIWSPIAAFSAATARVRNGTLSSEDAHHMFDKLLQQANPVPCRFLNAFLAALARAPASDACRDGSALALALFYRVYREEQGPQVAPLSVHTYNILMDCCCRVRRPDLGLAIFSLFLRTGIRTNQIIVNTFLKCLCYARQTDEAIEVLLHRMPELGCAPDAAYSIVAKGLCDDGRSQQALDLLQILVKEGGACSLGVVVCNTVINGFFKEGQVSKACNLFHRMPELGCAPNAFSYSIIAKGLCDDGRSQQALDLLQMVVKEGGTCSLGVVAYNTVINGFFKEGKVSKACNLFHRMSELGCAPDASSYSILVKGLCDDGRSQQALDLLPMVVKEGGTSSLSVVVYNIVINGLFKEGKVSKACNLFHEMRQQGVMPDVVTYTSIIDGLCKAREMDKAELFLRQMVDNGVRPDKVTYTSMIHGYSTLGQWKEASNMFREMKSQGLTPDIVTWSSLITSLHKHGRRHEAAGISDSMTTKCQAPQT